MRFILERSVGLSWSSTAVAVGGMSFKRCLNATPALDKNLPESQPFWIVRVSQFCLAVPPHAEWETVQFEEARPTRLNQETPPGSTNLRPARRISFRAATYEKEVIRAC